jgi:sugar O-acyltransferase (sialic acid O-acetyltransferase NeuD family)
VVLDAIEEADSYQIVGLLDAFKLPGTELLGYKTIGLEEDLVPLLAASVCDFAFVAIGDNWKRWRVVERLTRLAPNVPFATVIHPSARVARGVQIGQGTVIMAGASVGTGCRIGEFCILNTGSSLDHDGTLEDYVSLAPRAVTGGGVYIGRFSVLAIGATVSHDVRIGEHSVIGAGATVLDDICSGVVAYGTPARVVRDREPGDPYLKSPTRDVRPSDPSQEQSWRGLHRSNELTIITTEDPLWKDWMDRVPHDFFHTAEYHSIQEQGMGAKAQLVVYGTPDKFVAWPCLVQSMDGISDANSPGLCDVTSAYGFCGPLAHQCVDDQEYLGKAQEAILNEWKNQSAISAFTRFHPILGNHNAFVNGRNGSTRGLSGDISHLGSTVVIDLMRTPEEIWGGYTRQARQSLRRCIGSGTLIKEDPEWEHIDDFIRIYYATMKRNHANTYYFFPTHYLKGLKKAAGRHGSLLVAIYEGKVIAAGLLIEYRGIVNLHLLATDDAYAHLSPSKLIVHDAQKWAKSRGNYALHLGGGRGGRNDDSLFRFKCLFSHTVFPFYVGCWTLNRPMYERLAEQRRKQAADLKDRELEPFYFPAYRAPFLECAAESTSTECHGEDDGNRPID